MGFAPTSVNLFSQSDHNVGEAPQLSQFGYQGRYAEYDNGASVFSAYFDGATPLSAFSNNSLLQLGNTTASYGYTKITSLSLTGTSNVRQTAFVLDKGFQASLNSVYRIEGSFMNLGSNGQGIDVMNSSNPNTAPRDAGVVASNGGSYFAYEYVDAGGSWAQQNATGSYSGQWLYGTLLLNTDNSYVHALDGANPNAATYGGYGPNYLVGSETLYIGSFFADYDQNPADAYFNWVMAAALAPNGIMPSVAGPFPVEGYLHLAAINYQGAATSSPFQLRLALDAKNYQSMEDSGLTNVGFMLGSGQVLSSWLESGNSNSNNAIFWLKFPQISAQSYVDFYLVFFNSTNIMNGMTIGEGPNLSSQYGGLDNGWNVFLWYTNFAGSSRPPGFSQWT